MSAKHNPTGDRARRFADEWIQAWNSHQLDRIMEHYAEQVILISPVAATLLSNADGVVRGKQAVQAYFQKGLQAYPQLNFELIDVMTGIASVVLYFRNQKGTNTAEFMEFDSQGKIVKVVANYSC